MLLYLPCVSLQLENGNKNNPRRPPPESGGGLAQNWKPVFFCFFFLLLCFFFCCFVFYLQSSRSDLAELVSGGLKPPRGRGDIPVYSLGTYRRGPNPQRSDSAARSQVDFACSSLSYFLFNGFFFLLVSIDCTDFFYCLFFLFCFFPNVTCAFCFLRQKKRKNAKVEKKSIKRLGKKNTTQKQFCLALHIVYRTSTHITPATDTHLLAKDTHAHTHKDTRKHCGFFARGSFF